MRAHGGYKPSVVRYLALAQVGADKSKPLGEEARRIRQEVKSLENIADIRIALGGRKTETVIDDRASRHNPELIEVLWNDTEDLPGSLEMLDYGLNQGMRGVRWRGVTEKEVRIEKDHSWAFSRSA